MGIRYLYGLVGEDIPKGPHVIVVDVPNGMSYLFNGSIDSHSLRDFILKTVPHGREWEFDENWEKRKEKSREIRKESRRKENVDWKFGGRRRRMRIRTKLVIWEKQTNSEMIFYLLTLFWKCKLFDFERKSFQRDSLLPNSSIKWKVLINILIPWYQSTIHIYLSSIYLY